MKSIQQTRDEFFRLMADNGFESTGSADYDGNVIFAREWTRTCQVVWYGEHTSTYRVTARISFGTPLIQLYENGRPLGQRERQRHPRIGESRPHSRRGGRRSVPHQRQHDQAGGRRFVRR